MAAFLTVFTENSRMLSEMLIDYVIKYVKVAELIVLFFLCLDKNVYPSIPKQKNAIIFQKYNTSHL